MNLYFDTEFTGLVPGTTLISLGIVSETGDKFYAEFTDYDKSKVTPWIEENVLSHTVLKNKNLDGRIDYTGKHPLFDYTTIGDTEFIKEMLLKWLEFENPNNERVQFVSDVCHYDFYLLQNQVFGGAFEMPEYINPVCYDICQDINEWSCMGIGCNFNITRNMYIAFDISREKLVEDASLELPKGTKHNALYDAEVIKILYEYYYSKKFAQRKIETIKNFRTHRGFDSWFEDPEYVPAVDFSQKEYADGERVSYDA